MEVAPFFVDFHHFLSIFTIFYLFSRFTHFCRDLHFVAIYALFPQIFLAKIAITATSHAFCMYGYILGNFWPYLWHIYKKNIVQLAFSGDKLSHLTKCPTFSPATKCPNLCTHAQESYGKLLGHFVGCPTLLIWCLIPWAKFAHLAKMYWIYLGYILTTFWAVLGCTGRVIRIPKI